MKHELQTTVEGNTCQPSQQSRVHICTRMSLHGIEDISST